MGISSITASRPLAISYEPLLPANAPQPRRPQQPVAQPKLIDDRGIHVPAEIENGAIIGTFLGSLGLPLTVALCGGAGFEGAGALLILGGALGGAMAGGLLVVIALLVAHLLSKRAPPIVTPPPPPLVPATADEVRNII